jgi:hypothetical protein
MPPAGPPLYLKIPFCASGSITVELVVIVLGEWVASKFTKKNALPRPSYRPGITTGPPWRAPG